MNSLLIRVGDFWWVWKKLGKETGWLRAKVVRKEDELMPPVAGWQFYDETKWFNNWTSDPAIECYRKTFTVSNSHMKGSFSFFIFALLLCSPDVNGFILWLAGCFSMGLLMVVGLVLVILLVVAVVVCRCLSRR